MLIVQEDNYSIVTVRFEGAATIEDTEKYLSHFDGWLSRSEPFGLIVHQATEDAETEQAQASHERVVKWAKQNKPRIIQSCIGMAMVMNLAQLPEKQQAMAPKIINALFGCPGRAFTTQAEAEQWLQQYLSFDRA